MKLMEFRPKLINILKNNKNLKPRPKLKTTTLKSLSVTNMLKILGKFLKEKAMKTVRVTSLEKKKEKLMKKYV